MTITSGWISAMLPSTRRTPLTTRLRRDRAGSLDLRALLARGQLGEPGHHLLSEGGLGEVAQQARDCALGVFERVIEAHAGDEAEQIAHGGEGQLALHRRALDVDDARLRRQLGHEGVHQRRLADAHLADDLLTGW